MLTFYITKGRSIDNFMNCLVSLANRVFLAQLGGWHTAIVQKVVQLFKPTCSTTMNTLPPPSSRHLPACVKAAVGAESNRRNLCHSNCGSVLLHSMLAKSFDMVLLDWLQRINVHRLLDRCS